MCGSVPEIEWPMRMSLHKVGNGFLDVGTESIPQHFLAERNVFCNEVKTPFNIY